MLLNFTEQKQHAQKDLWFRTQQQVPFIINNLNYLAWCRPKLLQRTWSVSTNSLRMISWRGPGASPIPTDKCATSRHWPGDCGLGSMICTKRGRRKQQRLILENISNKGMQTSTYNPHPSLDIVYLRLYQTPFWMFGLPGRVHFRTWIGFRVLYFIVELRQIVRENPNGIKIGLFFKFRMNHILEFEYYDPIESSLTIIAVILI